MKRYRQYLMMVSLFCLILSYSPPLYSQVKKKESFIILNCPVNSGFFAIFSSVLAALDMYDQGNYAGIKIDLNSGIYLEPERGSNWWEYFFEPINLGDSAASTYVLSFDETMGLINAGFTISRERGFELIQKYIYLKPKLQKELDKLTKKLFKDYTVIGLHYRGTDKKLEAIPISHHKILETLNWILPTLPKTKPAKIFVATDEQNFITFLSGHYPGKLIYNDFVRSNNGEPVHYSNWYSSNYQKGKEALFDCLLLSKCYCLVFPGASSLSLAATKFNPFMTITALWGEE